MTRKIHFPDEKKSVDVTVKFISENYLKDLKGGYRPKDNLFEKISSIFSSGMFEIGAPACLYSKWNKNYNKFKTKVINSLLEKNQKYDDPMDNYETVLSYGEWENLSKSIGGIS